MSDGSSFRPPPEPAHVSIVRRFDDLIDILKFIRRNGQLELDRAFDEIASEIGFVFATTVPVTLVLGDGGKVEHVSLRGEHLKGTLFEKKLLPVLEHVLSKQIDVERGGSLSKGTYEFYAIWFEALKLKLGAINFRPPPEPAHFHLSESTRPFRPPPEPAHSYTGGLAGNLGSIVFRPPPEPAHWFDPGALISEREQVLIVALDEVYGELKLLERISSLRQLPSPEMC